MILLRFSDTLHMEGLTLCNADSDSWMQCNGDTYEYVAVYVDDLLCVKRPKKFSQSPDSSTKIQT